MDAPFSLPRHVTSPLLFAAGRDRGGGRRRHACRVAAPGGWPSPWSAAGSPRSRPAAASTPGRWPPCTDAVGARAAAPAERLAAVAVVGRLWIFSRTERRDRRRVLGTLAGYAVASVGLSAVSAAVPATWASTATFVEESGEALAGVAFLIAVLVGVAPRLVLPATWPLRRTADAAHARGARAVRPSRRRALTSFSNVCLCPLLVGRGRRGEPASARRPGQQLVGRPGVDDPLGRHAALDRPLAAVALPVELARGVRVGVDRRTRSPARPPGASSRFGGSSRSGRELISTAVAVLDAGARTRPRRRTGSPAAASACRCAAGGR